jgi:Tol biopolymer transport system component
MKPSLLSLAVLSFAALTSAHGQAISRLSRSALTPLPSVVAADVDLEDLTSTADGRRFYYITSRNSALYLYDRATAKSTKLRDLDAWDLSVAPNGTALSYTHPGEDEKDEFSWIVPLDPKTGLPTGPEHRVSTLKGNGGALSPDGKFVAFAAYGLASGGNSLMVVPTTGGPERTLAVIPGSVDNIRWSPDGKALYLGTTRDGSTQVIQRVAATGGALRVVARGSSSWPGLSPNGRWLAYRDTGLAGRFVLADTAGKRLSTIDVPANLHISGWSGNSTLLTTSYFTMRRLRVMSLAGRQSRVLVDSMPDVWAPRWSPDGTKISVVRGNLPQSRFEILDARTGETMRALPRRLSPIWQPGFWSPDGSRIAYHVGNSSGESPIVSVDVSSAREIEVPGSASSPWRSGNPNPSIQWSDDSRRLLFVSTDSVTPGSPMHNVVREADATGAGGFTNVSEEIKAIGIWPFTRDIVVIRPAIGQPIMLRQASAGAPSQKLLEGAPGYMAVPSISSDRRWLFLRRDPAQYDPSHMRVVELVRVDGNEHHTVTLPFDVAPGEDNPQFLQGSKQAVVVQGGRTDHGVYLMSLPSGTVEKLFTLPNDNGLPGQVSVSPDGKSLAYVSHDSSPIRFFEWNVASLVSASRR